jgi:DhnA family fructose-bisphosphate aldolase class Ia
MSDYGKAIRLNRILRGRHTGRGALIVAYDHPLVHGPIPGTIDPAAQIRRFVQAKIDGLLLNPGILRQCVDSVLTDSCPAIILRIDWTSVWRNGPDSPASCEIAGPEDALRLGADAVLTFMIVGSGDNEFERDEIARNARIARECERLGVPLIVEALARGRDVECPTSPEWLQFHSRVAAELGADAVKTEYSGDVESMRTVVEACPVPILVLGGSKNESEDAALGVIRSAMQAGAAGVFFGRNVFQANDISGFLKRARAALNDYAQTSAPRVRSQAAVE